MHEAVIAFSDLRNATTFRNVRKKREKEAARKIQATPGRTLLPVQFIEQRLGVCRSPVSKPSVNQQ